MRCDAREGGRIHARFEWATARHGWDRAPASGCFPDGGSILARVVTLRFDPSLEAFDDAPLQWFLGAREVRANRDHFFIRNEVPHRAVLVTHGRRLPGPPGRPAFLQGKSLGASSSNGLAAQARAVFGGRSAPEMLRNRRARGTEFVDKSCDRNDMRCAASASCVAVACHATAISPQHPCARHPVGTLVSLPGMVETPRLQAKRSAW